jgi:hypothetical protein
LSAVFTYTNGKQVTANNANEFIKAANCPAAANGGISNITIDGHGDADSQNLNYEPTGAEIAFDGNQVVLANNSSQKAISNGIPLKNLLAGKLSKNASINLRGCHAGDDKNGSNNKSIASNINSELGVFTTGSPGYVYEWTEDGPYDIAPSGYNAYLSTGNGHIRVP